MATNATYLFEKPYRKFHNAESWWTAYFTMLVLWRSSSNNPLELPWYLSDKNGNLNLKGSVSFDAASYRNMVADARLYGEPFGLSEWPNGFLNLRPDVTFLKSSDRREVVFVETKTIGAKAQGNVALYARLRDFLRSKGWSAELYYLLSEGHEELSDWPILEAAAASIILWEDVFKATAGSPFGELFAEPLSNFVK